MVFSENATYKKSEIRDEINKKKRPNSAKGPNKGKIVNKLYCILLTTLELA
jgi:hypothetical protein